MNGSSTPNGADLQRSLPSGSDVILEWNAAFRIHLLLQSHLGGNPPQIQLTADSDAPPLEAGMVVLVRSGKDARRTWSGTVVRADEETILLEVGPDPGNCRSYFRMPVRLALRIFQSGAASDLARANRTVDQVIARVNELSGGGCRFVAPSGALEGGETCEARLQLEEDRSPLEVRLQIVRAAPHPDGEEFAAAFLDLREPDRQRILRRLFEEYRRLRRSAPVAAPESPDPGDGAASTDSSPHGSGPYSVPTPPTPTPLPGSRGGGASS